MSRDDAAYRLSRLVESAAEDDPTHIAMVCRERQLSCGEMHSRSNARARWLFGSGVGKGDRVGMSLNKTCRRRGNEILPRRKDRQIKSRGYRVELDEVEAVLFRHLSRKGPCWRSPVPGGDTETRALGDYAPWHPARRARHTRVHGPVSSLIRQAVQDRIDGELSSHDHRKERSQEAGGPGSRVNEED